MRPTTLILSILIIILIVFVTVNYQKSRNNMEEVTFSNNTASEVEQDTVTVEYTDDGFSPIATVINSGDRVRFINKSSSSMWVASDPHPTHTNYVGFDEKSSAEIYTFTFTYTGTWGYHNHLNPLHKGTIIVQ